MTNMMNGNDQGRDEMKITWNLHGRTEGREGERKREDEGEE